MINQTDKSLDIEGVPKDISIKILNDMIKIRRFEEAVARLIHLNEIRCPCHLYTGQEAVAAGVCSALRNSDYVFSTHRSHGHYIAKGGNIKKLMAELYGKVTGCSSGLGGSMHISSPESGLLGSSSIVAGTIPLAVGAALSFSIEGTDSISTAFFGDGAVNEGVFYESLNFASLNKLPIIFICENNLYSAHMSITKCHADSRLAKKAELFNMPGFRVDGNNAIDVFKTSQSAIGRARRGSGPTLIECLTYRWCGHVGANYDLDMGIRPKDELDFWIDKCPIKKLENTLLTEELLTECEIYQIYKNIEMEVCEAIAFAKKSPYPRAAKKKLIKYIFKT